MEMILIDPSAEENTAPGRGADRLAQLNGKRVGLLDNIKHNAQYLLSEVGERLVREFGCELLVVRKKTYTKYCEGPVLAQLMDCAAVVTAIGD